MKTWLAVVAAATLASPAAFADIENFKLGARAGTLGYGAEAGVQLHKRVNLRASVTGAKINAEETFDGIEYSVNMTLGATGVQLDLFPLIGGVYLSGGVFSNENEVAFTAVPDTTIQIGDTVYTGADVGQLIGDVTFDDYATYAGLGWTSRMPLLPIETFFEAGAYFQGAPQLDYVATGVATSTPGFLEDLNAEAAEIEDELSQLEFYPVANIGLRLRF